MKLYFFRSIPHTYATAFLAQNRIQNTKVMYAFALVIFFFTSIVRYFVLSANDYQLGRKHTSHLETNTFFIITGILFSVILYILKKKLETHDRLANRMAWFYSLLFIGGTIWVSFLAQHNPSNTMTLLLLGLFCVSTTTAFSLAQTSFTILFCVIVFTLGIGYFQTDADMVIFNYIVFGITLICFFIISRLIYSFHANYFIKVKTIEEKNEEIAIANQSKNEILGIVAHDLRSPISNIQSLIELLQYESTSEDEAKIYISHIKTCCMKAEMIIKEIIIAAQEESNTGLLKLERVNINTLLSETQRGLLRLLNGSHLVELNLPKQEVILEVNKEKLQRALDNLLNNAVKFTPEKDGAIHIGLDVFSESIVISIRDNGIGIPPQHLPFLFDKFTSTGRAGLKQEPSVGLGLHISKLLVEKHKGTLTVESEENQGTTFYITLLK
jgi:two-component system sensor histidine kinase VicK